jgi:hypothetical protein
MKITPLGGAPTIGYHSDSNKPMTIPDLAAELDKSERSIRRWIADYKLAPAGQIGHQYAYWLSDLLTLERDTRQNRRRGLNHAQPPRVA